MVSSYRAIISLLPEEYRVEISTAKYFDEVESKTFISCSRCNQEDIPYTEINIFEKLNDSIQELILDEKYSLYWDCPHCHKSNNLAKSRTLLDIPADPFYVKIIPEPPIMIDTFSRVGFAEQFAKWYQIAVPELEHQIALFRSQYVSETDDGEDLNEEIEDFDDVWYYTLQAKIRQTPSIKKACHDRVEKRKNGKDTFHQNRLTWDFDD